MSSSIFVASGLSRGMHSFLARSALRLKQWEVAQLAGVPQWAVSHYERDRYVPPSWRTRIDVALERAGRDE